MKYLIVSLALMGLFAFKHHKSNAPLTLASSSLSDTVESQSVVTPPEAPQEVKGLTYAHAQITKISPAIEPNRDPWDTDVARGFDEAAHDRYVAMYKPLTDKHGITCAHAFGLVPESWDVVSDFIPYCKREDLNRPEDVQKACDLLLDDSDMDTYQDGPCA